MDKSAKDAFSTELECFITSAEKNIADVLSTLGWTAAHMSAKNDGSSAVCPLDTGHRMPSDSFNRHMEVCSLMKQGFSREEIARHPPDSTFCYEQCTSVVTVPIDENNLTSILGSVDCQKDSVSDVKTNRECPEGVLQTGSFVASRLSCEERLAVYDYVVAKGKAVLKDFGFSVDDMNLNFEKKDEFHKPKSRLELLAEERDYKRRRQSYRAKNVHITKKSYTELSREVIEKQMEYLIPAKRSVSERNEHPSHVSDDDFECRRRGSSKDSCYERKRRSRSGSNSRERRWSPFSASDRIRAKERDRHKRSRSQRRDRDDSSDSPRRSRGHKKRKHKHGHHRSRHHSSTRD